MLGKKCAALADSNTKLAAKVVDLEGRSRRNNIRIIGLPESIEGPRATAFFSDMLVEVFGRQTLQSPPELDRAHRALTAKPPGGKKKGCHDPLSPLPKEGAGRPRSLQTAQGSRSGSSNITLLGSLSSAHDTMKLWRACTTGA